MCLFYMDYTIGPVRMYFVYFTKLYNSLQVGKCNKI